MGSEQELIIRWEVDNLNELEDEARYSTVHYFADIPWVLYAKRRVDGFLLSCNYESTDKGWKVDHESTFRILHSSGDEKLAAKVTVWIFMNPTSRKSLVVEHNICEQIQGFVVNDKMTLDARIIVKNVHGTQKLVHFDFSTPLPRRNFILRVEGKEIHVGKELTRNPHSPWEYLLNRMGAVLGAVAETNFGSASYSHIADLYSTIAEVQPALLDNSSNLAFLHFARAFAVVLEESCR
ncbi:hypothetical protein PFISCL1PPCAC_21343, partial [Pristionchus fissidentatus]